MAIGLADLVRNGTMSAEIAATLAGAVEERRSFLVFAVPRLAGKSTVVAAMLARAPFDAPVRSVTGEASEIARLRGGDGSGYLVIPEISQYTGMPGYIWGAPVRQVFAVAAERGYALAAALHAPNVEEAFAKVCAGSGVPDEHAAKIQLAVYLRSIGEWQAPTRRVVELVHEIQAVNGGKPRTRVLHLWDEARDRFVTVNEPKIVLIDRWARLARDLGRAAVS
jgi:type IV secretory pathway ATPase VirB11/archaellum biosynthesis ATPase